MAAAGSNEEVYSEQVALRDPLTENEANLTRAVADILQRVSIHKRDIDRTRAELAELQGNLSTLGQSILDLEDSEWWQNKVKPPTHAPPHPPTTSPPINSLAVPPNCWD